MIVTLGEEKSPGRRGTSWARADQGHASQVRLRVAPLISQSQRGPAVNLDALLLALVDDVISGADPEPQRRSALLLIHLAGCM